MHTKKPFRDDGARLQSAEERELCTV